VEKRGGVGKENQRKGPKGGGKTDEIIDVLRPFSRWESEREPETIRKSGATTHKKGSRTGKSTEGTKKQLPTKRRKSKNSTFLAQEGGGTRY